MEKEIYEHIGWRTKVYSRSSHQYNNVIYTNVNDCHNDKLKKLIEILKRSFGDRGISRQVKVKFDPRHPNKIEVSKGKKLTIKQRDALKAHR
jgi:hypothetical protein